MLAQGTGGSIVTITVALARNPIRGVPVLATSGHTATAVAVVSKDWTGRG
jgi:hypothetical protein